MGTLWQFSLGVVINCPCYFGSSPFEHALAYRLKLSNWQTCFLCVALHWDSTGRGSTLPIFPWVFAIRTFVKKRDQCTSKSWCGTLLRTGKVVSGCWNPKTGPLNMYHHQSDKAFFWACFGRRHQAFTLTWATGLNWALNAYPPLEPRGGVVYMWPNHTSQDKYLFAWWHTQLLQIAGVIGSKLRLFRSIKFINKIYIHRW